MPFIKGVANALVVACNIMQKHISLNKILFNLITIVAILSLNLLSLHSNAQQYAVYQFANQSQELLFKELTYELRCMVCANQSLAESNTVTSNKIKDVLYKQIIQHKTKQEIIQVMQQSYGEQISYTPELNRYNFLLWLAPLLIFLLLLRLNKKHEVKRVQKI